MKRSAYIFLLTILFWACSPKSENYSVSTQLTETEQKELLYSIIRYLGHLPKKATHDSKFDASFDEEYTNIAAAYAIDLMYQHPSTKDVFLLVSRQAPSLLFKKVATGIVLNRQPDGSLLAYEERFRTWKMVPEELEKKGLHLFDLMVKGKDLSPFYPENSGKEEYIEFPSEFASYDKNLRRWVSSRENPVEEMYNAAKIGS